MRLAIATGVFLTMAGVCRADVKTAVYVNGNLYTYELQHMPDLDQRREANGINPGLPGNGSMYCVPTSTANMMAYIANHGFPSVLPGPANWQLASKYNDATALLQLLGTYMSTTADDGTNGQGWHQGAWLWLLSSGKFVVSHQGPGPYWAPTQKTVTQTAINGAIVSVAYCRYKRIGTYLNFPLVERDGGHAVTLSRSIVNAGQGQHQLFVRDPANPDDGKLYDQSLFGDRLFDVEAQIIATGQSLSKVRLMSALNFDPNKEKNAYLSEYLAIRPKAGYSFKPAPNGSVLQWLQPFALDGHKIKAESNYPLPGPILDSAIAPDWNYLYVLAGDGSVVPAELLQIDLASGEKTKITSIPGAKKLVFGRKRNLYVSTTNKLLNFHSAELPVPDTFDLPYPVDAIAYDDKSDEVLLLSNSNHKILKIRDDLKAVTGELKIPASIDMSGMSTLAVDPSTAKAWFITEKSLVLHRVDVLAGGDTSVVPTPLLGIGQPTSFDFDDRGRLFAAFNGAVFEFEPSGQNWKPTSPQSWTQFSIGPTFKVLKSRSNWTPDMFPPGKQHIDPSELSGLVGDSFIPDCVQSASNTEYGQGKSGAAGVPHLRSDALPYLGVVSGFTVEKGRPGALPIVVVGVNQIAVPFDGGTLLASPQIVVQLPVPIAADGTLTVSAKIPADPSLCGLALHHQVLIPDPSASGAHHLSMTNGLTRTLGN